MENQQQTELASDSSGSSESSVQSNLPVQSEPTAVEQQLPVFVRNQGMKKDLCNVSPISTDIDVIQISILYMAGPFLVVEPNKDDDFNINTHGSNGPSVCTQIAMKIIDRLDMKKEPPVTTLQVLKTQFRRILEEDEAKVVDEAGSDVVIDPKTTDGLLSDYTKFPKLVLFRQGGTMDIKQSRLVVVIRVYASHLKNKTVQRVDLPPKQGDKKDLFLREAMIAAALEIARSDLVALETSDVARNARVARDKENRGRLGRASVSLKNPSRNAKRYLKFGTGAAVATAAVVGAARYREKIGTGLNSTSDLLKKTRLGEKLME